MRATQEPVNSVKIKEENYFHGDGSGSNDDSDDVIKDGNNHDDNQYKDNNNEEDCDYDDKKKEDRRG